MMFVIMLEEEFPIFSNSVIERMLNHEAREAFLSALVAEGLYRSAEGERNDGEEGIWGRGGDNNGGEVCKKVKGLVIGVGMVGKREGGWKVTFLLSQ
ncbi:hypothetical protein GOBAR_DD20629 [Gossypium barbadense]|nr:hypothetical protein GOBAR_DD20629 [Gossypium barbadense]